MKTPKCLITLQNKFKKQPDPFLAYSLNQLQSLNKRIEWIKRNRKLLNKLLFKKSITGFDDFIDFDRLTHAETIQLISVFHGEWKKTCKETTIDYTLPFDGMTIRVWNGEPPPSCKIVEETIEVPEILVPAHTEKKRKLQCI